MRVIVTKAQNQGVGLVVVGEVASLALDAPEEALDLVAAIIVIGVVLPEIDA